MTRAWTVFEEVLQGADDSSQRRTVADESWRRRRHGTNTTPVLERLGATAGASVTYDAMTALGCCQFPSQVVACSSCAAQGPARRS